MLERGRHLGCGVAAAWRLYGGRQCEFVSSTGTHTGWHDAVIGNDRAAFVWVGAWYGNAAVAHPGLFFGFRYLGPWVVLLRTGFTALVVTFAIDLSAGRFALVSANPILNAPYDGALSGLGMGLISAAAAIPGAPVCTRAFCSWLLVGR